MNLMSDGKPRPCGGAGKHECLQHEVRAGGGFIQSFFTRPRFDRRIRSVASTPPQGRGLICEQLPWGFIVVQINGRERARVFFRHTAEGRYLFAFVEVQQDTALRRYDVNYK